MTNCQHCEEDISSQIEEATAKFSDYESPEQVEGLKSALEKTREEKRKLKAKDETMQNNIDALTNELDALQAATVPKSDFDALTTELEERQTENTTLRDEATTGKIATAVAKAGGSLAMLSPMIKAKMAENPKLDIDVHLATLKNDSDFGGAFKASDQSGGGGPSGKTSSATFKAMQSANLRRGSMTDAQKNEYQKTHGLDALLDLPL